VVGGLHDGHLITAWVTETEMQLTVLLLISSRGIWSEDGLEDVESEGDDGLVWRQQSAHGASWASITRVTSLFDGDLGWHLFS